MFAFFWCFVGSYTLISMRFLAWFTLDSKFKASFCPSGGLYLLDSLSGMFFLYNCMGLALSLFLFKLIFGWNGECYLTWKRPSSYLRDAISPSSNFLSPLCGTHSVAFSPLSCLPRLTSQIRCLIPPLPLQGLHQHLGSGRFPANTGAKGIENSQVPQI